MGQLIAVSARTGSDWLRLVIEALQHTGCVVVTDVLDSAFLEKTRTALYRAQQAIGAEVGADRLERAKELGVLRLPMKAEAHFLRFLEIPELLQIVDATLSPAAILHLQNGFILPSFPPGDRPRVFQGQYHRDFPRYLNGYLASLNALFAIDAFTEENGATRVAPGTHQRPDPPSRSYLEAASLPVLCSAGSMLVFDSTVWHAAGENVSGHDRLAINHQFTRSFFKPQIDYVRALGDDVVLSQPPRTQQLLGWYTRVPATLGEYYRGPEDRLYRAGQG